MGRSGGGTFGIGGMARGSLPDTTAESISLVEYVGSDLAGYDDAGVLGVRSRKGVSGGVGGSLLITLATLAALSRHAVVMELTALSVLPRQPVVLLLPIQFGVGGGFSHGDGGGVGGGDGGFGASSGAHTVIPSSVLIFNVGVRGNGCLELLALDVDSFTH